jgi:hypothetical protein
MLRLVSEFQALLVVAIGLAAILYAFVWLARRVRRSGVGGGLMGPIDEIYHPTAHRFRYEIQVHEERMVPLPSARDLTQGDSGERDQPDAAAR